MSNKDKQMIWSMDFKQDNKKEAIIFYKLPDADHSVYLAVYEKKGMVGKRSLHINLMVEM